MSSARILESDADIESLLDRVHTVAVLGIKPESRATEPAHYVPAYAQKAGFLVVPVPIHYPEANTILGIPVVRSLLALPRPIDLVSVFRRPSDLPGHLEDLLTLHPKAVWMQTGIRNDEVALRLVSEGVDVVQDKCLLVELKRLGR